ncbi:F-box domain [Fusarium oxysporum f. sp. vasinfectum]|nr:F-box domain [Fusarium oxysporum f. sp. vasinfectum]
MEALANEIWDRVFEFLDIQDLKHVALINKRLSSCVTPSLFHQLSIDEDGIQKLLENHEHKNVTDHVKVLKIYPRTYDLFAPGSVLARLATSWKSGNFAQHRTPDTGGNGDIILVSDCILTDISEPGPGITQVLPAIQEILISVKGEEKPQDLVSVMSRFTCLKKLMVRAMSLDLPSQLIWPSLEHFEFEHILGIEQPMEIDPDRLKRCFEKHKQLKTVIFAHYLDSRNPSQGNWIGGDLRQFFSLLLASADMDNSQTLGSTELDFISRISFCLQDFYDDFNKLQDKMVDVDIKLLILKPYAKHIFKSQQGLREAMFQEGPDVTFIFRPMPLIESALQGAKIEIGNYSERVYGNGGDLDKFHKLYHDSVGGRFSLFVKAQPHTPSRSPVTRTFI